MAIKVNITGAAFTGKTVTFTAPCGCDKVTDGLSINGEIYTVCDAMGNCVTGVGGTWASGAQVSVVLDCEKKKAFIISTGSYAPAPLKNNLTLYVSATGSDETGDGTKANPFRQIQKAINSIPKDLGGCTATVSVGEGTFEAFTISGFSTGALSINGVLNKTKISGQILAQYNSAFLTFDNLVIDSTTNGIFAHNNTLASITNCTITASESCVRVVRVSISQVSSCTLSNAKNGLMCAAGVAYCNDIGGSGNTYGYDCGSGSGATSSGLIIIGNDSITATTKYVKYGGAHIIHNNEFK